MRTLIVLIAVICMAGSVSADMIAHWTFDEGSGQTLHDSVGGNNGTIYGATWTAGKTGGALSFNGTNSYVDVPDSSSLRFTENDSFSIAYWAKPDSMSSGGYVMSKLAASGSTIFGYASGYYPPAGYFNFYAEGYGFGYTNVMAPANSSPYGNWYFVTAVYSNENMKLYVNGVLESTGTFTINTDSTVPTYDLCIGAYANYNQRDHYYKGLIDDLSIYNNALTAAEIQQLYNVPEPATLLLLGLGAAIAIRKQTRSKATSPLRK